MNVSESKTLQLKALLSCPISTSLPTALPAPAPVTIQPSSQIIMSSSPPQASVLETSTKEKKSSKKKKLGTAATSTPTQVSQNSQKSSAVSEIPVCHGTPPSSSDSSSKFATSRFAFSPDPNLMPLPDFEESFFGEPIPQANILRPVQVQIASKKRPSSKGQGGSAGGGGKRIVSSSAVTTPTKA